MKLPRLHAHHHVHVPLGVVLAQTVDQGVKAVPVLEQRGQIVEKDAGLRVIRNFANQFLQFIHRRFGLDRRTRRRWRIPSLSIVLVDREARRECSRQLGFRFGNLLDRGVSGTLPQFVPQRAELLFRSDRVNFHSAIAKISDVAADAVAFGGAMRKITIPDALHPA